MPLTKLFAVEIDTVALEQMIQGVQAQDLETQVQALALYGDGQLDPNAIFVDAEEPMFGVTTTELKEYLASIAFADTHLLDSGAGNDGVKFYFAKYSTAGVLDSGSVHTKLTVGDGLIVPTFLDIPSRGFATAGFDVHAGWDQSSDTLVAIATSQALPSISDIGNAYGLGKVTLNGTTINYCSRARLERGFQIAKDSNNALNDTAKPVEIYASEARPTLTLQSKDLPAFATFGAAGTLISSEAIVYAARRNDGGAFYAANTSNHIKLTIALGMIIYNSVREEGGVQVAEITIEIAKASGTATVQTASDTTIT